MIQHLRLDGPVHLTPKKVRSLRRFLNLNQDEFAVLLGVSTKTVVRWERAHTLPEGKNSALLKTLAALVISKKPAWRCAFIDFLKSRINLLRANDFLKVFHTLSELGEDELLTFRSVMRQVDREAEVLHRIYR